MPEQAGRPRSGSRGRLAASGGALEAALVLGCPLPASAEVAGPAAQCQIADPRLAEVSGLVVVDDQLVAINDGGDQVTVFLLDAACQVADVHTAAVDPYDPEDLAVAADGTVWLADAGDTTRSGRRSRSSRCGRTGRPASTGSPIPTVRTTPRPS